MIRSASICFLLLSACSGNQEIGNPEVTILPGEYDLDSMPVHADFENSPFDEGSNLCAYSGNDVVPAQVERLSDTEHRIWWLASKSADESVTFSFRAGDCSEMIYEWEDTGNQSTLLRHAGRPVLQYERPVFDSDDIEETKKPFHHVYDPAGDQLITKGPGGLYSHHRGIFFGYNHVYVNGDDTRVDIWHANDGERSEHAGIVTELTGPVMGGHIVEIDWKDHDGDTFITEKREMRAFRQADDVTIIDFKSTLTAVDGPVLLDGDRQHAGVQFRAAQDVAENSEETRYIRPEYLSHLEPDEEIEGTDMMNLPWNSIQFVVEERPYMAAYLSHPSNPDDAEMSERLYGRFGEFFTYEVTPDQPLQVRYRFIIKSGSLSPGEIDAFYQLYADAPDLNN